MIIRLGHLEIYFNYTEAQNKLSECDVTEMV